MGTKWKTNPIYVGFEVSTAVVKKSCIFWDITPCHPLKANRCFGGTHHLLKMEAICSSETSTDFHRLAICFYAGILLRLFFDPEDGGDIFLRNIGWLSADYTTLYPRRQYSS
jgi:hypothetical protein